MFEADLPTILEMNRVFGWNELEFGTKHAKFDINPLTLEDDLKMIIPSWMSEDSPEFGIWKKTCEDTVKHCKSMPIQEKRDGKDLEYEAYSSFYTLPMATMVQVEFTSILSNWICLYKNMEDNKNTNIPILAKEIIAELRKQYSEDQENERFATLFEESESEATTESEAAKMFI